MRLHRPLPTKTRITQQFAPSTHFGLDLSCPIGTPVYAMLDGTAFVANQAEGFGIYIRVDTPEHQAYAAQLSQALVVTGQQVKRGQLIGYSGNTGNSTGPHLHSELRRIAGSPFRNNAVLIEPWIDWFDRQPARVVGAHIGNDTGVQDEDWRIMDAMRPGSITLLPSYEINSQPVGPDQVREMLRRWPGVHIILRPYIPPSMAGTDSGNQRYIEAVGRMLDGYRFVPDGQIHLQFWNEQNMPRSSQEWEGFGSQTADMQRFNRWFVQGYNHIKARHPRVLVGWTPLTIGNRDCWFGGDGVQNHYLHGASGCKEPHTMTYAEWESARRSGPCYESLMLADELYAHVYISDRDGQTNLWQNPAYGLRYERIQFWWPEKKMWIKEWGHINRQFLANAGSTRTLEQHAQHVRDQSNVQGLGLWLLGDNAHWGGRMYTTGNTGGLAAVNAVQPTPPQPPGGTMTEEQIGTWISDFIQAHVLPLNPDAALYKAAKLRNSRFTVASPECRPHELGITLPPGLPTDIVCQAFRDPLNDAWQEIAWTKVGEWAPSQVRWIRRRN